LDDVEVAACLIDLPQCQRVFVRHALVSEGDGFAIVSRDARGRRVIAGQRVDSEDAATAAWGLFSLCQVIAPKAAVPRPRAKRLRRVVSRRSPRRQGRAERSRAGGISASARRNAEFARGAGSGASRTHILRD
jgi:hypothetical protein